MDFRSIALIVIPVDSVGHSDWTYFSAVCWLYGKYLWQHRKYPIGLVATSWGGTPIEAWSSYDAYHTCEPQQGQVDRYYEIDAILMLNTLFTTVYFI